MPVCTCCVIVFATVVVADFVIQVVRLLGYIPAWYVLAEAWVEQAWLHYRWSVVHEVVHVYV